MVAESAQTSSAQSSSGCAQERDRYRAWTSVALGVSIAMQSMFVGFYLFGERTPKPAQLAALTEMGRSIYRPESDIPVYLLCCGLAVAVTLALYHLANAKPAGIPGRAADDARFVSSVLAAGCSLASTVAMLLLFKRLELPPSAKYEMAALALLLSAVIFPSASKVLRGTVATMLAAAAPVIARLRVADQRPGAPSKVSRRRSCLMAAAVGAAIFASLYVPSPAYLAGDIYRWDGAHHWDFFVMAPAVGFAHGGALGSEIYSQYGLAWPVLFAAASPWLPLSYASVVSVFSTFACFYFFAAYLLLFKATRSVLAAAAGVAAAIYIQMFTGNIGQPLWYYPSSTVIRSPLDIAFFWVVWTGLTRKSPHDLSLLAFIVGLAILFETDTGLYLAAALLFFVGIRIHEALADGSRRVVALLPSIMEGGLILLATVSAGLAIASRGDAFRQGFVQQWLEVLALYPSGMSMIPVFSHTRGLVFSLLPIGTYLVALCFGIVRIINRPASPRTIFCAIISLYGLGYFLQFIGRSAPENVSHVIVPAILVLTIASASITIDGRRTAAPAEPPARPRWPAILTAVIAALLFATNASFWRYPNLLQTVTHPSEHAGYQPLIRQPEDIFLPPSSAREAAGLQRAAEEIRRIRARGGSVAILSSNDTVTYLAARAPLWHRYSPAMLLTLQSQVSQLTARLRRAEADYALVASAPGKHFPAADVLQQVRRAVQPRYQRVGTIGPYDVWRRRQGSNPHAP